MCVLVRVDALSAERYSRDLDVEMAVAVSKSLAGIVRDSIDGGILPTAAPFILWTGFGTSRPCSVCGQPILPAQAEYDLQYEERAIIRFRFHLDCYGVWEAERRRRGYLRSA